MTLRKRAFTLVELLVIVAIISILAAVLFPVFSSASATRKQADSLAHIREIGRASLAYAADYDENFVLMSQNAYDDMCPLDAGAGNCIDSLPSPALDWPLLLLPYAGSLGVYVNPETGDPLGIFGDTVKQTGYGQIGVYGGVPAFQNYYAQYGYNQEFLSPVEIDYNPDDPGWLPTSIAELIGFQINGMSRSVSVAVHPAQTVMFASTQWWPIQIQPFILGGGFDLSAPDSQWITPDADEASPPGTIALEYAASDRVAFALTGSTSPFWASNWAMNTYYGEVTGDVRTQKPMNGAQVAWVDGHVSTMTATQLAKGTDFTTATSSENGQTGCVITDVSQYLWTLDGTLTDVE